MHAHAHTYMHAYASAYVCIYIRASMHYNWRCVRRIISKNSKKNGFTDLWSVWCVRHAFAAQINGISQVFLGCVGWWPPSVSVVAIVAVCCTFWISAKYASHSHIFVFSCCVFAARVHMVCCTVIPTPTFFASALPLKWYNMWHKFQLCLCSTPYVHASKHVCTLL